MRRVLVIAVAVSTAASARAGGVWVGDHGAQGMQRAGAFCAKADDGTALAYNPAGLMSVRRFEVYAGMSVIGMRQRFQRAGAYPQQPIAVQPAYVGAAYPEVSSSAWQPIPFLAAAARRGRVAVAVGVVAPHAQPGRDYPATVEVAGVPAPAPQRYDKITQEALIASPSIAAAVAVTPWLDAGARLSWGFARVRTRDVIQGQPGPAATSEQPENDALAEIEASDGFVPSAGVGVKLRAGRHVELAAAWSSPLRVRAKGSLALAPGALVSMPLPGFDQELRPSPEAEWRCGEPGDGDVGACLDLDLPQTLTVAARWVFRGERRERGDVELDGRWEQWSAASDYHLRADGVARLSMGGVTVADLPINEVRVRHGLEDVWSVRLGGGAVLPVGRRWLHVRGGAALDSGAAPESWTRVDVDGGARLTLAAGAGLEGGGWRVDAGTAWVHGFARRVVDRQVADVADVDARVQPDIAVPLTTSDTQPYHPFNAGRIETGYLLFNAAISVWW